MGTGRNLAENREIALVFSGDIAKLGDIAPCMYYFKILLEN
jgi:hypothetical protein